MTSQQNSIVAKPVQLAADKRGWGAVLWLQRDDTQFFSRSTWFVFEGGLIYARGWPVLSVQAMYPWADVQALRSYLDMYLQHDEDLGSVITQVKHVLDLKFTDTNACQIPLVERPLRTLARDFFEYGMRADEPPDPVAAIAKQIRQKVAEAQFPLVCSQLEAGQEVRFGPLSATIAGIRIDGDGQLFPWNKVSAPYVRHHYSRFKIDDQSSRISINVTDQLGHQKRHEYVARYFDNLLTLELVHATMNSASPLMAASEAR